MSDGADPPADAVGGSMAPGGADDAVAGAPAGGEEPGCGCARHSADSGLETDTGSPERDSAACGVCVPGVLGVLLSAAVLGGVGVWLYLHFSGSAEHRASHRIDELRQRLDQLSHQFGDYAARWERSGEGTGSA